MMVMSMPSIIYLHVSLLGLAMLALAESARSLEHPINVVASQTFSLRQSFYHYPSGEQSSDLHIFSHEPEPGTAKIGSTTSKPATFLIRAQPVNRLRTLSSNSKDASQQVFVSHEEPQNGEGPLQPNVTDKATIVNLAKMTSDAYYADPNIPGWLNLTDGFNRSRSFGWQKDGLRGHVFANADNSTVIIAFKGTTISLTDKLRTPDRENDNVLFSCCCATQRTDPYWYGSVCGCRNDTFSCNQTCLTQECGRKDRYYAKAKLVVQNVTSTYPDARLWMVGHSLGGAMASLMGMTFHTPVVTFEAVPERLPAERLGLQMEGEQHFPAYHFGNTADPVYMRNCSGLTSLCSAAGYAFESKCFTGKRCVYDTVADKGWYFNLLHHRISNFIAEVLEKYDTVPNCFEDDGCEGDCDNWSFF